jgi:hypothetical protein
VLLHPGASLVYFTALPSDQEPVQEFKGFNKLARALKGSVKVGVFRLTGEDAAESRKKFRLSEGSKPELKFFPNSEAGEQKLNQAFGILFNKESKHVDSVLEEVSEGMQHTITEISPAIFNSMIVNYAQQQQKNIVYFMYAEGQAVSIAFKALSTHPLFKEDSVFLSLFNPPLQMFPGLKQEMMPSIGIVHKIAPDFVEG